MDSTFDFLKDKALVTHDNLEPVVVCYEGTPIKNLSAFTQKVSNNPSHFKTEYNKSLINLDLKGNTEQKSYNGYNYFDINNINITGRTEADITTYAPKVENGILYSGGQVGRTSGGMVYIPWDTSKGKAYLSFKAEWDSTETRRIVALTRVASPELSSTKQAMKQVDLSENGGTYLLSGDTQSFPYVAISAYSTTQYGLRISNIQISYEEAPYEPYVGGKPSPNVEYPQPINSSSNVELMLSGAKLYDDNLYLLRNTVSKIGNEYDFRWYPVTYYTGEGTAPLYNQVKSNLKPNIKYTMASKWSSRGGGVSGNLVLRTDSGIVVKDNFINKENVLKLNVINLSKSEINSISTLWVYGTSPSQMDAGTPPTIGNAMIFVGEYTAETLPPFDEPYIEPTTVNIPIELNKLGDVADELVVDYSARTVKLIKRIEKFYLKDQIASVVIDTSWEFGNVAIVTTTTMWKDDEKDLCSHCKRYNDDTSILSFDCSNNDIQFYIVNQSTPADFIQWATDNNVEMALVLAEPSETVYKYEDEDETSIPDWVKALLNLSPKRNQTNVITITADLPISELNIKFAKWGGADE